MKKTDKLSKYALSYITPALRAAIYDCSDSMHEEEKYQNKFDALADDKFEIQKYIEKYHLDDYIKELKDVVEEEGSEPSNWEEFFEENIPGCIPIPYEKIKHKLESL